MSLGSSISTSAFTSSLLLLLLLLAAAAWLVEEGRKRRRAMWASKSDFEKVLKSSGKVYLHRRWMMDVLDLVVRYRFQKTVSRSWTVSSPSRLFLKKWATMATFSLSSPRPALSRAVEGAKVYAFEVTGPSASSSRRGRWRSKVSKKS